MLLMHRQLGCIFNRDDAFFVGNKAAHRVEHRSFSTTRSAADQNVSLVTNCGSQKRSGRRGQTSFVNQVFDRQPLSRKTPDR